MADQHAQELQGHKMRGDRWREAAFAFEHRAMRIEYVLRLLVAAGHVTQEKVDEACALAKDFKRAPSGVKGADEPSDTERLQMVLHAFTQREDNMPLTPSERDVLHAFDDRGSYTNSMRLRVIDSAIRVARAAGVMAVDGAQAAEQLREATRIHGYCKSCHALHPQHHVGCTAGVKGVGDAD